MFFFKKMQYTFFDHDVQEKHLNWCQIHDEIKNIRR